MRILGSCVSNLQMFDLSLRICVVPFAAASIWVNVTSRGESVDYGKLEFKNLLGLKYMVCVSAVSAGYALLTALASCLGCIITKQWVFLVADQVFAYLVLTSTAAQIEFLYLAYHGNLSVAWGRACVTLGKMCIRMKLGLGLNVTVLWCFMVLSVISGYRFFRTFQPPAAPSSKQAHQECYIIYSLLQHLGLVE